LATETSVAVIQWVTAVASGVGPEALAAAQPVRAACAALPVCEEVAEVSVAVAAPVVVAVGRAVVEGGNEL
jgi:hypothetical protein